MSQFDEDRHIVAVFDEIGYGTRILADIGARLEGSNAENLIRNHGFTGVLADASEISCGVLEREFPQCTVLHQRVLPREVNEVVPREAWFLTIDIDSTDWWMWANLMWRPALVVIETNPLPGMFVAKMECSGKDPDGYGASLGGMRWLAEAKRYDYIGRTLSNAFFVRSELQCRYRLPEIKGHAGVKCTGENNVFR